MRSGASRVKASPPRNEPLVRVPDSFGAEFPDGSALATEAFLNIGLLTGGVRSAVEGLLRRHSVTSFGAAFFGGAQIVGEYCLQILVCLVGCD